jgi:ferredoxin-NADP reductase/ferredoxin
MSGDYLRVTRDGKAVAERPLSELLTIGRHQNADLQLEDPQMSRLHAEVVRQGAKYFLRDKRSLNGSFLNGRRLEAETLAELGDGMTASIAGYELRFHVAPASPATVRSLAPPEEPKWSEAPPPSSPLLDHLVAGRERIPVWAKGEITLQVADIIEETDDVKTFRLVGKEPVLFSYKPGQFVTVLADIGGQEVKRSYSISSSPSRPHTLELTVKRVPKGLVSNWMCDELKLGSPLRVRGPSGRFSCFDYPSRKMLCIAAGSGVTPIMSMCRWIVDTTADVDVVVLYSCQTPDDIIYRKEFELLSARHSGLRVLLTVTKGWKSTDCWTGLMGRCNSAMLAMAAPDLAERHVFMCGPAPFMDCAKDALRELAFPLEKLHTESFGAGRVAQGTVVEPKDVPPRAEAGVIVPVSPQAPAPARAAPVADAAKPAAPAPSGPAPAPASSAEIEVEFLGNGAGSKRIRTNGRSNLLDLAECNGIEIPYACRTGECGTCKVLHKRGDVEMNLAECPDPGLDAGEKKEGYVLACISYPRTSCAVEVVG